MENLKSSSVIPLLFIVFFSIYTFSKSAKKYLCIFLMLLYLYFCLSRGFRITAVPVVLLIYLAFYEGKINNNLFCVLLIFLFFLTRYIGAIKDTGSFDLINAFINNSKSHMILSHHADILYTASATVGLIDQGVIDPLLRIEQGFAFLLQSFILPSFFPETLRYPLVISYFTSNGGGGLFLAAEYMFGGFLGVFLGSYLINKLLLKAYESNNERFVLCISVMVVFSCNWISYDFHTILRFPLYALIIYLILKKIQWRYFK